MHVETPRTTHPTNAGLLGLLLSCCLAVAAITPVDTPRTGAETPRPVAAGVVGGIAARLFDGNGTPLPGHVFLLIGPADATSRVQVHDTTAYRHGQPTHPETEASNVAANRLVRSITGTEVAVIDMTSASGGGPSGGLTRAVAYLNLVSDGAFTGEIRVAATGELDADGHLRAIDHIDAKTVAARVADVDVLFSPTLPTVDVSETHAARVVGESTRHADSGRSLHDPDRLRALRRWGAERPAGMDVVDVRHLIDVSAYLCGAGSAFACEVTDAIDSQIRERLAERTAEARSENERLGSRVVRDPDLALGRLVGQL